MAPPQSAGRDIKRRGSMDTSDTTEESVDMSTKKSSSVVRARTNRRRSKTGSVVIKDLSFEDQARARKFDIDGDGEVSLQLGQLGSRLVLFLRSSHQYSFFFQQLDETEQTMMRFDIDKELNIALH
jgi:hypothetical protein